MAGWPTSLRLLLLVLSVGFAPGAVAADPLARSNLRLAEERLAKGDLELALAWAGRAVAADPGPDTLRAREIIVDVALELGQLEVANRELAAMGSLSWLDESGTLWTARARSRLDFERAEGEGDLARASALIGQFGRPEDDAERAWFERAEWRYDLRELELSGDLATVEAALGRALSRPELEPWDRAWLSASLRRARAVSFDQTCAWGPAIAELDALLAEQDLREPDRRWAEVRREIFAMRLTLGAGLGASLSGRLATLMARQDLSAWESTWARGLAAYLAFLEARGSGSSSEARTWAPLADAWVAGEPSCSPPFLSPSTGPEIPPLEVEIALGVGVGGWRQKPSLRQTPYQSSDDQGLIIGIQADALVALRPWLGLLARGGFGLGDGLPGRPKAALALAWQLQRLELAAGVHGGMLYWARFEDSGPDVRPDWQRLAWVQPWLAVELRGEGPVRASLELGLLPSWVYAEAQLSWALDQVGGVRPVLGLEATMQSGQLESSTVRDFTLKTRETGLLLTAGARVGGR